LTCEISIEFGYGSEKVQEFLTVLRVESDYEAGVYEDDFRAINLDTFG